MMMSPLRILCRSSLRQSHAAMTQRGVDKTFHSDSTKMNKFPLAEKYHGLEKNVWVEFIQLALEYKPLNLGQGFPDDLVPYNVLDSLSEVAQESLILNQYTRGFVSKTIFSSESKRFPPGTSPPGDGSGRALHQAAEQGPGSGSPEGGAGH